MVVVIRYDSGSGSDSAASGAGPDTPVTGAAAAHTGGAATTTITLTGSPDLSGVAADDVLYLDTASGRHLTRIASVDNGAKTVTVDDTFTISGASPVDYAIGGWRASFEGQGTGQEDWLDYGGDWTVQLVDGDTQSVSVSMALPGGALNGQPFRLETEPGYSAQATITFANLFDYGVVTENANRLNYEIVGVILNSVTAQGCPLRFISSRSRILVRDTLLQGDDGGGVDFSAFECAPGAHSAVELDNVRFEGEDGAEGIRVTAATTMDMSRCQVRGSDVDGMVIVASDFALTAIGCKFTDNSGSGIVLSSFLRTKLRLAFCTLANNGGDGLEVTATIPTDQESCSVSVGECIVYGNTGYGFNATDSNFAAAFLSAFRHNAMGSNTSGNANNVTLTDTISLTANPFTNAAGNDYSLNSTAGGGAAVDDEALVLSA